MSADHKLQCTLVNNAPELIALWEAAQEYVDAEEAWTKAQEAASAAISRTYKAENALRAALNALKEK